MFKLNSKTVLITGAASGIGEKQLRMPCLLPARVSLWRISIAATESDLSETNHSAFPLPLGHPEGFIEAFANIYRDFATSVRENVSLSDVVPSIAAGVRGMAFVKSAVKSSRDASRWVSLAELQIGVAI